MGLNQTDILSTIIRGIFKSLITKHEPKTHKFIKQKDIKCLGKKLNEAYQIFLSPLTIAVQHSAFSIAPKPIIIYICRKLLYELSLRNLLCRTKKGASCGPML